MSAEINAWPLYHAPSVSEQEQAAPPAEAPVDPVFSHAASPFERTEPPAPVAFASPPPVAPESEIVPASAWTTYRTQIYFGGAILAYLMVLTGSVILVQDNPGAGWRYEIALLPLLPGVLIIGLLVRLLSRADEVQKRRQLVALGFSMAATALLTFSYGFLESVGLPDLNLTLVLPVAVALWALALAGLAVRSRLRR